MIYTRFDRCGVAAAVILSAGSGEVGNDRWAGVKNLGRRSKEFNVVIRFMRLVEAYWGKDEY
jgi:hypothetical protein